MNQRSSTPATAERDRHEGQHPSARSLRPRAPRRSLASWRLAGRALRVVIGVRIALWRWPYAKVRERLHDRRSRPRGVAPILADGHDLASDAEALAWAVRVAARRVPRASCLTQALALDEMLVRAGQRGIVRLGVARRSDGTFEAHAWVEHDGRVLIGRLPDLDRFSVLPGDVAPGGLGAR